MVDYSLPNTRDYYDRDNVAGFGEFRHIFPVFIFTGHINPTFNVCSIIKIGKFELIPPYFCRFLFFPVVNKPIVIIPSKVTQFMV